eukprot:GHVS01106905.1.p1 GENE.GHVS01106905.1~~GHVS01106905.1.p1  ORF type:complete len:345 (-),score=29.83 GHVS01106905.1:960-1928(-)
MIPSIAHLILLLLATLSFVTSHPNPACEMALRKWERRDRSSQEDDFTAKRFFAQLCCKNNAHFAKGDRQLWLYLEREEHTSPYWKAEYFSLEQLAAEVEDASLKFAFENMAEPIDGCTSFSVGSLTGFFVKKDSATFTISRKKISDGSYSLHLKETEGEWKVDQVTADLPMHVRACSMALRKWRETKSYEESPDDWENLFYQLCYESGGLFKEEGEHSEGEVSIFIDENNCLRMNFSEIDDAGTSFDDSYEDESMRPDRSFGPVGGVPVGYVSFVVEDKCPHMTLGEYEKSPRTFGIRFDYVEGVWYLLEVYRSADYGPCPN